MMHTFVHAFIVAPSVTRAMSLTLNHSLTRTSLPHPQRRAPQPGAHDFALQTSAFRLMA